MKEEGRCIVCGSGLHELAQFKDMPAGAQHMPAAGELEQERSIELKLCQCPSCGTVQFDTEPVWYYKDVIRAGGETKTMHRIRCEEYEKLLSWMDKKGIAGRKIIEIGCGRGEFMKVWDELSGTQPVRIVGIEHSHQLVETGRNDGLEIYEGFAEEGFACAEGPFDAFVQFNFLEHQPDPMGMLRSIKKQLTPGAIGLVTVPGLEYILAHHGYYELIRDHIAYYSEETLTRLMQMAGFTVLESGWVNRDTIEIIVESTLLPQTDISAFTGTYIDVTSLQKNFEQIRETVNKILDELETEGKRLAVWGASHQGFTVISTTRLKEKILYIIDSSAFKQGKYAPASHVPIIAPDDFMKNPADVILIAAPGYTDEIAGLIKEKFGPEIQILVLKTKTIKTYEESIG